MIIYHEISKELLDSILQKGLKCNSSGHKSNDMTKKVDTFLDRYIPKELKEVGISRSSCIYGYVGNTEMIIDIKNGNWKPIGDFIARPKTVLLRLEVDKEKCFISNLNSYDKIKTTMQEGAELPPPRARLYWKSLIPFSNFVEHPAIRPEVMIPHSISPKNIHVVS